MKVFLWIMGVGLVGHFTAVHLITNFMRPIMDLCAADQLRKPNLLPSAKPSNS